MLNERINQLTARQETIGKLIIHFLEAVDSDKNILVANICSYFFSFEI